MKYLSENVIKNKRVILRCDFNVPIKDGVILDTSKITKSLETINYLLGNNNFVIILSHFGRVKSEEDKINNSLEAVYKFLKKYIDIDFAKNPLNLEEVTSVTTKKCILVENTRFTDVPEKKESANDLELAKYWSTFADAFVLDAFASMHRAHSSTAGISMYLETYIGFLAEKELNNLYPLVENTPHPFTVIMGGAKVDDKIKIIESILKRCDKLILTGGILNTFLKVKGINVGNSLVSDDAKVLDSVKKVLDNYANKLFFTDSFIVKRNETNVKVVMKDILNDDIIYDNIPNVSSILKESQIVFFNGTCGKYEESSYECGTFKLLRELNDCGALVYVGGGDTVSAVNKFGFTNSYRYLSSGGGATLEYVAYGKLKALEFIEENN